MSDADRASAPSAESALQPDLVAQFERWSAAATREADDDHQMAAYQAEAFQRGLAEAFKAAANAVAAARAAVPQAQMPEKPE